MRWVLFIMSCLLGSCSEGQNRTDRPGGGAYVIEDSRNCDGCAIHVEELATLGSQADSVSIRQDAMTHPCMVGALSTGEFAVSGLVGGGQVAFYRDGFIARTLGRRGEGPREFGTELRLLVGADDTLYVVDNSNLRLVRISPKGDLIGSFRLPGRVNSFAQLSGGEFLLHARPPGVPAPDRRLFWLLDPTGSEISHFGRVNEDLADIDQRLVSPAEGGGFWSASGWRYQVHRWYTPDSLAYSLVGAETSWFPQDQVWSEDMYTRTPPPTWFIHMWEEDGLLWTYSMVPDRAWSPGPSQQATPEWTRKTFDTMIEVIDLRNREALAELRFDDVVAPVCGASLMYSVVETSSGDTQAKVMRFGLSRNGR